MGPAFALVLFSAACGLAARSFVARRRQADRLALVDVYGYRGPVAGEQSDGEDGAPAAPGGLAPRLGQVLVGRMDPGTVAKVRSQLLAAGRYDETAEAAIGLRALAGAGVPGMVTAFGLMTRMAPGMLVLFVSLAAFVGYALPRRGLEREARERLGRIDRTMPELVDLLVVAVESGMAFPMAMRTAAGRLDGPLADELKLLLQEQSLGTSTSDSLRAMLDRCDTPALRSFVTTIIQGERLGVSVGHMLRTLALEMRKRRRASAEELAHKAPVKILFPLVLLIFPALFIVLMGPAALSFLEGGLGG